MDIRVLRYFIAAAEAESISRAAERLYITQPTLSRQFVGLEKELGHKLFERLPRKLRLTPKGELFLERARAIVDLCERTKRDIRADNELSGEIRIAAGETPALKSLARAIKRLREAAPCVKCHITSGSEETVKSELYSGLTDLGVFVGNVDMTSYSSIRLKGRDRWGVLTREDGPFAGQSVITAEDLIGEPVYCSRQSWERNEFAGWLESLSTKFKVAGTFNLLYNAYLLAEAGAGHVLALQGIINPTADSGVVWLPLSPAMEADVTIAWERGRRLSTPIELLLDFLREEEETKT